MEVWELIAKLTQYPAGAEVTVGVRDSTCVEVAYVELADSMLVNIVGGEAQILDNDGEEIGALAEFIPEDECD